MVIKGKEQNQKRNRIENIIVPIVLAILSFYDFNRGIDLTDAGYSLHYFEFFEDYAGADVIAIFWSNVLGNLFTRLPGGDTWYGISFYCTFVIMLCTITGYFFVKKYMDQKLI